MSELLTQFSKLLNTLIKRFRLFEKTGKTSFGVTVTQSYIIGILHKNKKLNMSELSGYLGLKPSTVTRLLDTMEKNNHVIRKRDESDRRITNVCLSDEGRTLAAEIADYTHEYIKSIFDAIPEDEIENVIRVFDLVSDAFEKNNNCCCE